MPQRPDPRAPLTDRAIARLSPLPRAFYARDPITVARELLGKLLIRFGGPHPPSFGESGEETLLAGRIVETEAYLGASDPGAHSYRGPTPRNAVLFGPPGHAYVYFIYGNHYCTNVSCQPAGVPGGVLFRALEPVCGIPAMAALRHLTLPEDPTGTQLRRLTSGPGRLSAALGITRPLYNACDLCSRAGGLYIAAPAPAAGSVALPAAPNARAASDAEISATPRINVTRAPHDEFRFFLTANPFVSGPRSR